MRQHRVGLDANAEWQPLVQKPGDPLGTNKLTVSGQKSQSFPREESNEAAEQGDTFSGIALTQLRGEARSARGHHSPENGDGAVMDNNGQNQEVDRRVPSLPLHKRVKAFCTIQS